MTQKQYLCIQRSQTGQCEPPSPEQMQQMFAKFNAWKEKYQENIVNMGGKLLPEGKIVTADGATDGPFIEAKEIIGGYMIIAAENIEQAIEVVRESPGVGGSGSSVEIREIHTP